MSGPDASTGRQVASQSPLAGASAAPGSAVSLTLALTVPALNGLDCEQARSTAHAHGFASLNCGERYAGASHALHRVFEQTPRAGAVLATPQALEVAIAKSVRVPDVVGQGLKEALAALDGVMLQGVPDGREGERDVRTEHPAAGSEVAPHSEVSLTTQRFEKVPMLVGLSLSAARARLESTRLEGRPDHTDRPDSRTVDEQQPPADTRVESGSAVALKTHVEVLVPNVMTKFLPAATEALRQAGLQGLPDHSDHETDRKVRSQSPPPRAVVVEHSDVALVTVRMVAVPNVVGQTCESATQKGRDQGVTMQCKIDSLLPFMLGQPVVKALPKDLPGVIEESTVVELLAVPPPWSTPLLLTMLVSGVGGLGWRIKRWIVHPPPAAAHWRLAPDNEPVVSLRVAGPAGDHHASRMNWNWRVVDAEALACVRGTKELAGELR
jgi:beta-lactam-binding protein with PASTA domain